MKILQINCTYREGSTGKITYDLHRTLENQGIESVVCYGRGSKTEDAHVYKICSNLYGKANNALSRLTGVMYGGCLIGTHRLIDIIRREKPDVVHLQCINGYFVNIYRLVSWLKKEKIPTVLTLHAEFMYTANCGHALDCDKWLRGCGGCPRFHQETLSLLLDHTALSFRRMANAFRGVQKNLTVVAVSQWLEERAARSPILAQMPHQVIYNGIDTEVFSPIPREQARKLLGWPDGKIIFHATAMFSNQPGHLKGGSYVIQLAERLKKENVTIVVAGMAEISAPLPENLLYIGQVQDQKTLAACYSGADLTVIASQKETFSMICAESLCCGTPVIGFRAGAPEEIALKEYSAFQPYGDLDSLSACAREWIERPVSQEKIAQEASRTYSKAQMAESYMELYRRVAR